jgi:protein-disulfide isomerase
MKRFLPFLIILVVLAVAVGSGWYLKNRASAPPAPVVPPESSKANVNAASPAPAAAFEPGAEPAQAIGPADAPVTLEEFGDFQCPPCGLLHPELKKLENLYGPKLRIVFREFPLVPAHQHALVAARAAEAAGLQGKFWPMHDMIYETQRAWSDVFDARPIFEEYARRLGLDVERYKRDLNSSVVERRIFLDGKRAHSLGVKGTPTLFMNGRELPFDSLPAEKMQPLIDAELARAGR